MAKNYHTNWTGRFKHVAGMDNPADILTKPVVGEPFFRHRASKTYRAAAALTSLFQLQDIRMKSDLSCTTIARPT